MSEDAIQAAVEYMEAQAERLEAIAEQAKQECEIFKKAVQR